MVDLFESTNPLVISLMTANSPKSANFVALFISLSFFNLLFLSNIN